VLFVPTGATFVSGFGCKLEPRRKSTDARTLILHRQARTRLSQAKRKKHKKIEKPNSDNPIEYDPLVKNIHPNAARL